jgi:hypothetical protein
VNVYDEFCPLVLKIFQQILSWRCFDSLQICSVGHLVVKVGSLALQEVTSCGYLLLERERERLYCIVYLCDASTEAFSNFGWSMMVGWIWAIKIVFPQNIPLFINYFSWVMSSITTASSSTSESAADALLNCRCSVAGLFSPLRPVHVQSDL